MEIKRHTEMKSNIRAKIRIQTSCLLVWFSCHRNRIKPFWPLKDIFIALWQNPLWRPIWELPSLKIWFLLLEKQRESKNRREKQSDLFYQWLYSHMTATARDTTGWRQEPGINHGFSCGCRSVGGWTIICYLSGQVIWELDQKQRSHDSNQPSNAEFRHPKW